MVMRDILEKGSNSPRDGSVLQKSAGSLNHMYHMSDGQLNITYNQGNNGGEWGIVVNNSFLILFTSRATPPVFSSGGAE